MPTDWEMPRRSAACARCQRMFAVGETVQAYLYESPAGYQRVDCCLTCRPAEQVAPLAAWRTVRPAPTARKMHTFDRETCYRFFERLDGAVAPTQLQFRFVLALLLWRKKVLRLDGTFEHDGHEIWQFTATRTGQMDRVRRPDLDEEQLECLSDQLERLLAGSPGEVEIVSVDAVEERPHE